MEAIIFIILLALAVVFFIAAEYLDVVLHIAGFFIIFLLGITILASNLEFKTGESLQTNYTYLDDNTTVNQTMQVRTAEYTSYSGTYSRILGIIISGVGMLGGSLVWLNYRKKPSKSNEL